MAYFKGITDEYSDYSFARRVAGIGGVLGFGALAGVALTRVNNSATLRSLGHEWERVGGWKHYTGSILSTGDIVNRSTLVRQSLEHGQHMFGPDVDVSRITSSNKFLDKVVDNQKSLIKHKLEEADNLSRVATEAEAEIEELGFRAFKNSRKRPNLMSDDLNDLVMKYVHTPGSNFDGTISLYNANLTKAIELQRSQLSFRQSNAPGFVPSKRLQKSTERLYKQRVNFLNNKLKGKGGLYDFLASRRSNYLARMRKLNFGPNDPRRLSHPWYESLQELEKKVYGFRDELDKLKSMPKNFIMDPESFTQDDWLGKQMAIAPDDQGIYRFHQGRGEPIYKVYKDPQINKHKANIMRLKRSRNLQKHTENIVKLNKRLDEFTARVNGRVASAQVPAASVKEINKWLPIIQDYKTGRTTYSDFQRAMYKIGNADRYMSTEMGDLVVFAKNTTKDIYGDMQAMSKYRQIFKAGKKTRLEHLLERQTNKSGYRGFSIAELLDEYIRVPQQIMNESIADMKVNNISDYDLPASKLGTNVNVSREELERTTVALRKARTRTRNIMRSEELLNPTGLSRMRHQVIQETRNIRMADAFVNKLTRGGIDTPGKYTPILGGGKPMVGAPGFIQMNLSNKNEWRNLVDDAMQHTNRLRTTLGSSTVNSLHDIYQGITPHKMNAFDRVLFTSLGAAETGAHAGISRKFSETMMHKSRGIKKIINAIQNKYGASGTTIGVKTQSDASFMTLRLIPTLRDGAEKLGQLDIDIPITDGNMLFKSGRGYIATQKLVKFNKDSRSGTIRTAFAAYLEDIMAAVEKQPDANQRSIEAVGLEDSFKKLQKQIEGKSSTYWGYKGTAGEGMLDITDKSFMEGMQSATVLDDVKQRAKTSKMNIKNQERQIAIAEIKLFSLQNDDNVLPEVKKQMALHVKSLRDRLGKMRAGQKDALGLAQKLAAASSMDIDGKILNVRSYIAETQGMGVFTTSGIGAENQLRGRLMSMDLIQSFLPPDIARNMKNIYNAIDTLDFIKMKMAIKYPGSNAGPRVVPKPNGFRTAGASSSKKDFLNIINRQYENYRITTKDRLGRKKRRLSTLISNLDTSDLENNKFRVKSPKKLGDQVKPVNVELERVTTPTIEPTPRIIKMKPTPTGPSPAIVPGGKDALKPSVLYDLMPESYEEILSKQESAKKSVEYGKRIEKDSKKAWDKFWKRRKDPRTKTEIAKERKLKAIADRKLKKGIKFTQSDDYSRQIIKQDGPKLLTYKARRVGRPTKVLSTPKVMEVPYVIKDRVARVEIKKKLIQEGLSKDYVDMLLPTPKRNLHPESLRIVENYRKVKEHVIKHGGSISDIDTDKLVSDYLVDTIEDPFAKPTRTDQEVISKKKQPKAPSSNEPIIKATTERKEVKPEPKREVPKPSNKETPKQPKPAQQVPEEISAKTSSVEPDPLVKKQIAKLKAEIADIKDELSDAKKIHKVISRHDYSKGEIFKEVGEEETKRINRLTSSIYGKQAKEMMPDIVPENLKVPAVEQYTSTGVPLSLDDEARIRGIVLTRNRRYKHSPLMKRYDMFKVTTEKELKKLQWELGMYSRNSTNYNAKFVHNQASRYLNRHSAFDPNLFDVDLFARGQADKIIGQIEQKRDQLAKMTKIHDAITGHDYAKGFIFAEMGSDELSRYNDITKMFYNKPLSELVYLPRSGSPSTTFSWAGQRELLQSLGMLDKNSLAFDTPYSPFPVKQLKMMQVSDELLDQGATILSESGAKKMGTRVKHGEASVLKIAEIDKAYKAATRESGALSADKIGKLKRVKKILTKMTENKKSYKLSDIHKMAGSDAAYLDFLDTMNVMLRSGSSKILKYHDEQSVLMRQGKLATAFTGVTFRDQQLRVQYDVFRDVVPGSKLVGETTDKYLVNAVLDDASFLRRQRTLVVKGTNSAYTSSQITPGQKRILQLLQERYTTKTNNFVSDTDWKRYLTAIKGSGPEPTLDYMVAHKYGNELYDGIGSNARRMASANAANNKGRLFALFEDLSNIKIGGKSVQSSAEMRALMSETLTDILDVTSSAKNIKDNVKKKLNMMKNNRAKEAFSDVITITANKYTTNIDFKNSNLSNLYDSLINLRDVAYNSEASSEYLNVVKRQIENKTKAPIFRKLFGNTRKKSSEFVNKIMMKVRMLLHSANPNGPLNIESVVHNVFDTTQDLWELTSHSVKGSYDVLSGFKGGTKLSLYDVMMMKLQGMPYTGDKIIQHMKHGRGYIQNYTATLMRIMGMEPEKYMDGHIPSTRAFKLKQGMGGAKIQTHILKLKKLAANHHWDTDTGMPKQLGLAGLLDIGDDIDTDFLGKGIFTREFLDKGNYLDDINRLDDAADTLQKMHGMKGEGMLQGLADKTDELFVELNMQDAIKDMDVNDQVKYWKSSATRIRTEDIEKYQKLTRRYKEVAFGTDPMRPKFNLHMNSNGKQISSMKIQLFGYDKLYDKKAIDALSKQVDKYREINILRDGVLEGTNNKVQVAVVNEAHRSQLAVLKAIQGGAPSKVINILHNDFVESMAAFTKSGITQTMKKGLPGTIRAASRGQLYFDAAKLNVWSILGELSSSDLAEPVLRNLNWKAMSEPNAINLARETIEGIQAGGKGQEIETLLSRMLKAGDTVVTPNPGQTLVSSQLFREGLDSLNTGSNNVFNKEVAKVMKQMYVSGNQSNFMTMGARFPTLKELNVLPLKVGLFDNTILSKIGLEDSNLDKQINSLGGTKTALINIVDALQMGGDLDRDQYNLILGLDDTFGVHSEYQKELTRQMNRQHTVKYEIQNANGQKAIVVETLQDHKKTRGGDLITRAGKDATSTYNDLMEAGYNHETALKKSFQKHGVETISIESDDAMTIKTYFTGKDRNLLMDNKKLESLGLRSKGELNTADIVSEKKSAFRKRVMASTIDDPDKEELRKALAGIMDVDDFEQMTDHFKKFKGKHNALADTVTNKVNSQLYSQQRTLLNMGYSPGEIAEVVAAAKAKYANVPADKLRDVLKQSGNKQLNALLATSFKDQLPELTGSIVAVKSLTGEIHNTAKYTLTNLGTTLFGKDTSKALSIQNWGGDLSQINISAKHRIPLVSGDIVNTINTIVNPDANITDILRAESKMKLGQYEAFMSQEEIQNVIKTRDVLEANKGVLGEKAKQKAHKINRIANRIKRDNSISNVEYLDYLQNVKSLSQEGKQMRSLLETSSSYTRGDIDKAIKGIKKSIDLGKNSGMHLLEERHTLMGMMKTAGVNNIRDLTDPGKILQSRQGADAFKMGRTLRGITNPITAFEGMISDLLFDKQSSRFASKATKSLFHNHSVASSIDIAAGQRMAKSIKRTRLSSYVDADSFAKLGLGGMIGMAAVGFIGAFALQSNKRDWLGPTAGTGGEYAERIRGKNEEKIANMNVTQRLKDRDIRVGAEHYRGAKPARIMPKGIRKQHAPSILEQLNDLREIPGQMEFHRFNR